MRTLGRSTVWLVLAAFLAGQAVLTAEFRHGSLNDDTACVGAGGAVTGSDHLFGAQFENIKIAPALEHCAICHMQRAAGRARPASAISALTAPSQLDPPAESPIRTGSGVHRTFPPRGPPAVL